jgi:hypothetical protein
MERKPKCYGRGSGQTKTDRTRAMRESVLQREMRTSLSRIISFQTGTCELHEERISPLTTPSHAHGASHQTDCQALEEAMAATVVLCEGEMR